MNSVEIYRKRLIPEECIHLKDDIILSMNEDHIISKWMTLKPKQDLDHGFSCYFLKEGIKVSKFYRKDNSLICWYCDIVSYEWDSAHHVLTATDLLIDILVFPDGSLQILDLDELADAEDQQLISSSLLKEALRRANHLLTQIYAKQFHNYTCLLENM